MSFRIHSFAAAAGNQSGAAYELTDGATVRAEVWPQTGFNCLRWQARLADGSWGDILFTAPDWATNPVPTRSGHPILFPFPGRLRDGQLSANGRIYQLPLNDSTKRHAIHGFTPRNPWRVGALRSEIGHASIEGLFQLSRDLPSALGMWPSDFELSVVYSLFTDRLAVDAKVANRGTEPLPFGLGYHPYFRLPGIADADVGGHVLQADIGRLWQVDADNLPTGNLEEVPEAVDFRKPKAIGSTALDHAFTRANSTRALAELSHPQAAPKLRIVADAVFRDLVLFTPPHRRAVAIEPYTCSADASHLAARGLDSGWQTLPAGGTWHARVEYCLSEI